ncbi:hypothetical protein P6F26_12240 [Roseibacterium sp. SDUM158017]|uniref:hypothetical protein n=1 Tax=Roseicyclus salinarum TaxID=3036773 RepID=UPI0024154354|nr:hypothetical protein [Roseibacterium sp. SDUM158017]MDG4649218.1 hypothetical protein [Roseibacterium sp. SDUM158017]
MRFAFRAIWLLPAVLMLPACNATLMSPAALEDGVARAEWVMVDPEDAWVNVPDATIVLERRFADVREQRLSLPNRSTLSGDNFAHIRAVPSSQGGVFDQDRALASAGGLPVPFAADDLGTMRSREDAAGAVAWTEWTDGAGTYCVLALRRLTSGARVLPEGAIALDVVLRNCVPGGVETALAPVQPSAVAFAAPRGIAQGANVLTLSPLAAPAP